MKISFITPGAGQQFYCQNCFRDAALLDSLVSLGHELIRVPLYLPSGLDADDRIAATPVFYGAVNLFLKEKVPLFRRAPAWVERIFDSPAVLRFAAKKTGSTRAAGLEEMTLSMLHGENGRQAAELDHLIGYFKKEVAPDIVHLSNALLLGLARRLKKDVGAAVICSLQDENEWIDLMDAEYQKKVWDLMAEKAADVDLFVTSSRCFAEQSKRRLRIPEEKIKVVYGGIDFKGYEPSPLSLDPPVIGYLCRMSEYFGFHILVDAFLEVKKDPRFKELKLHATGGYSGDDKPFIEAMLQKAAKHGFAGDIRIFPDFSKEGRIEFLKSLTLLSVPVPGGESFGAYQLEALAAGVPVVQPNVGCYPEFIEMTGGGLIYEPNTSVKLAGTIVSLLAEPERIRSLGSRGRTAVLGRFGIEDMANIVSGIYGELR